MLKDSLWLPTDPDKKPSADVEFESSELESLLGLFAKKTVAPKPTKKKKTGLGGMGGGGDALADQGEPSPLEPKRVFNCSLLLKKLIKKGIRDEGSIIAALRAMEPSQLLGMGGGSLPRNLSEEQREALTALDETQRSAALEVVVLLGQCSPTAEETAALEAIDPDKRKGAAFGPVEQWFLRVGAPSLQPLDARLTTMKVMLEYRGELASLSARCEDKLLAATAAVSSDTLRYWCHAVLAAGNFLNHGSAKLSKARAYKLNSLFSKLSELRSPTEKGVTLLTFMMTHCRDAHKGEFSSERLTAELAEVVGNGLRYPFEQLSIDLRKQEGDSAALSGAAAEAAELRERSMSGELRVSLGDASVDAQDDRFSEVASDLAARHGALTAEAKAKHAEVVVAMKAFCKFCGERADAKGGDALLEAMAGLFAKIAKEPPLPTAKTDKQKAKEAKQRAKDEKAQKKKDESESVKQIRQASKAEHAAAEQSTQEAAVARQSVQALDAEMRKTLSEIDALRMPGDGGPTNKPARKDVGFFG